MSKQEPIPWNLCVVSHRPDLPNCGELANGLLYGESVLWLPTELPELFPGYLSAISKSRTVNIQFDWSERRPEEELERRRAGYEELFLQIEASGMNVQIPPTCHPQKFFRETVEGTASTKEWNPGSTEALINEIFQSLKPGKSLLKIMSETMPLLRELEERRPVEVRQYLADRQVHGCIIETGCPYSLQLPAGWDAHQAAQLLLSEMSRLLLPDVSRLPLPEVAKLKEQVKDYLDPARADMLRLSKQLRAMIKEGHSPDDVAREAGNLIATEVEPVIRESARQTEQVIKSRWKKLLRGAVSFVSLAGLGFLNPAMFGKEAATSGVNLITEVADATAKVEPPTQAAHFVLEVRRKLGSQ